MNPAINPQTQGPQTKGHSMLEGAIAVSGGIALYSEWHRPENPIGVVVLVHGLGEHIGRYTHVCDFLTQKGYAVLAYDHRGHGRSGGIRGHVDEFSDYSQDLLAVVAAAGQHNLPVFILAHSMGALVTLDYLNRVKPTPVRSVVMIGMPIKPQVEVPWLKETLAGVCSVLAPQAAFSNDLDARYLSRNDAVGKAYLADPLVNSHVTASWYSTFLKTIHAIPQELTGITVPALFLHGGDDHVAHPDGSRVIFQAYPGLQKQLHIYEGCYHELLNEDCYPGILEEIHQWYQQA